MARPCQRLPCAVAPGVLIPQTHLSSGACGGLRCMHRPLLIGRGTLHAPEFRIIALPMRRHFNIARRAPAEYKAFLAELEKRAPLDRRDEFRTAIAHLGDVGPRNQRAQVMLNILLTIVEVDHDAACRALSRRRRILWQPRSAADPVVWIDMRKFN